MGRGVTCLAPCHCPHIVLGVCIIAPFQSMPDGPAEDILEKALITAKLTKKVAAAVKKKSWFGRISSPLPVRVRETRFRCGAPSESYDTRRPPPHTVLRTLKILSVDFWTSDLHFAEA